ncbi:MAG: hypothetical protein NT098_04025 [Candidatus Parcubacteria bacterium]|nr:hypothetical protein [Candidatus Parcubacteria bacterium]
MKIVIVLMIVCLVFSGLNIYFIGISGFSVLNTMAVVLFLPASLYGAFVLGRLSTPEEYKKNLQK